MNDPLTGSTGARGFTHLDEQGRARMVDVGGKDVTRRRAVARARITMQPETAQALDEGTVAKGDVLAVARVAGIQAAKRTSELIPLCHPLILSSVVVDLVVGDSWVGVEAVTETVDRTGVEMEALVACSVAALTVYDMCKAKDRSMTVESLGLHEKSGGRSGDWRRDDHLA
ncbi:MAG: cyclic pyranopterin monophosphate synthase MoaC [Acidimicrobiales bacterium]|nr:cyclic pyranopterin monophosphate synthase MoaC [Acidimicrobiales bacterium]